MCYNKLDLNLLKMITIYIVFSIGDLGILSMICAHRRVRLTRRYFDDYTQG